MAKKENMLLLLYKFLIIGLIKVSCTTFFLVQSALSSDLSELTARLEKINNVFISINSNTLAKGNPLVLEINSNIQSHSSFSGQESDQHKTQVIFPKNLIFPKNILYNNYNGLYFPSPNEGFTQDNKFLAPSSIPLRQWPYSLHGRVRSEFRESCARGSGALIGERYVLTVGHCMHDNDNNEKADKIIFEYMTDNCRLKSVRAEYAFTVSGWTESNEYSYDYGILILEKPIEDFTQFLGIAVIKDNPLLNCCIEMAVLSQASQSDNGSKINKFNGIIQGMHEEDNNILYHNIDTKGGCSGAQLWNSGVKLELGSDNNNYYSIAIHQGITDFSKDAVRISEGHFKTIMKWLQYLNHIKRGGAT